MFLEFYKLREQPFGVTPDPRFLYFGSTHREALASLLYAIEAKRGFSALVAEPGMGKTSLLFQMLQFLRESARTAFLFQTEGSSRDLLRNLLHDLGISAVSQDPVVMHTALNETLLQESHAGRPVVVVIDEAQNLDEKVLETVRLLSNFETSTQKLMHIVLAGQPGLAAKLSEKKMMQLRQRVSTVIRLEPFRREEAVKYIEHRLRAAGHQGPPIFSADALEMVSRVSQGIPRNINSLCFQALSIGFATQSKQIGAGILREVISDLDFTVDRDERPRTQGATPRPPIAPEPARFPDSSRLGAWDRIESPIPSTARRKWVAAIACLAVVPVSVIAFTDSNLGLTKKLPGQISGKIVNAVLNSNDPNAEFVPARLSELKPPQPPPGSELPNDTSTTDSSDDRASAVSVNAGDPAATSGESDRAQATQTINERRDSASAPAPRKDRKLDDSRGEAIRSRTDLPSVPTRVQVLRSETLFQFALELYGQSNWEIVEAIRAANPQIRDPYDVLSSGEWIQLPSDLVTVTANYNSYAAMGKPR